ncbi:hypothetical protein EBV26_20740 [bacterium]|nr:hypothetical protein [bacterium]
MLSREPPMKFFIILFTSFALPTAPATAPNPPAAFAILVKLPIPGLFKAPAAPPSKFLVLPVILPNAGAAFAPTPATPSAAPAAASVAPAAAPAAEFASADGSPIFSKSAFIP